MDGLFSKWCKSIFFFEKTKLETKLSINYVTSYFFKKWTYTTFKINGPSFFLSNKRHEIFFTRILSCVLLSTSI